MEEKTSWVVHQILYVVEIDKIEIQSVLLIEKLILSFTIEILEIMAPLQSFYEASEGKQKLKRLIPPDLKNCLYFNENMAGYSAFRVVE